MNTHKPHVIEPVTTFELLSQDTNDRISKFIDSQNIVVDKSTEKNIVVDNAENLEKDCENIVVDNAENLEKDCENIVVDNAENMEKNCEGLQNKNSISDDKNKDENLGGMMLHYCW
ncbi:hypothetical protein LIER_02043 [Lithospermum erythrorhizon]|uniref:Uncharacterized protein n=1 Tax=Lithospermum erythrorhizon TaxID=34254 RepID=A0AAV3NNH7_LITER